MYDRRPLQIREKCRSLILDNGQLRSIMQRFDADVRRGLAKETHDEAMVKCFVTYVQELPNGKECGKFLALDLGGTNFRVLLIELSGKHFEMHSKIYAIPQAVMLGSGENLFNHIADCLAEFIHEHRLGGQPLPLGFTFSFPLRQTGLTHGYLVRWTKGFDCAGTVDADVVRLLQEAIARRGDVDITVCAILNDTTGTLMSCAWRRHNCRIGLIIGTGTNACYVERVSEAPLFDAAEDAGSGRVLINTEWGAFGDDGALDDVITKWDREIDERSINRGTQKYEKMISGMYMGELARLVIADLTRDGYLFDGKGSDILFRPNVFLTKYISEIEQQKLGEHTRTKAILEDSLGLEAVTEQDCVNVRYVCEMVSRRAAHLVSATLATLLVKMDEHDVTIGVDGSVYRYHPHFHTLMMEKIGELVPPHFKFDLMLSEDGSGRGAALVAAVASRDS